MIKTRTDLKRFNQADSQTMTGSNMFVKWITRSDDYLPALLVRCLRKYEYYLNQKRGIFNLIPYLWYWWNFRRLRVKTGIMLFPNTIDEGLHLVHPGFRRIGVISHIGKNCTILPNVLIGRKEPGEKADVYIGDDCYISTGVTILGPVTIGNNVTIGAGAVVTKDVPDNCIVGGIPAKILKYKE